jgi:hypothetical protein
LIPGCAFGKKAQVWKRTNFDAGLYDITGFWWALIISMYLQLLDFGETTIYGNFHNFKNQHYLL